MLSGDLSNCGEHKSDIASSKFLVHSSITIQTSIDILLVFWIQKDLVLFASVGLDTEALSGDLNRVEHVV